MNGEASLTQVDPAAVYLQQLQELAREMDVAMTSIAANALPDLEDSVARQEMICVSLGRMSKVRSERARTEQSVLAAGSDAEVERKIAAATGTLRILNQQYAALLKHSGRSIALLSSLCKSHTGNIREDRGSRLKHQTWSCEM